MGISAPRLLTDEGSFAAFLFAIELLPVAAYACDADGLIIAFNRAAEEMWGRTPARNHPADRWCGSLGLEMPDGTPISHADCAMAAAVRERTPYLRREVVLRRPDGSRRWALAHACPVIGRDGGVLGATNTLVDITDRRDAEREAVRLGAEAERIAAELMQAKRETERALVTSREIFHQEPHCVKIVDADGVVMDINAAGLNAIEAESIEEIRGRSSLALIAPEWREAYRTALRDAIEFGHSLLEFEILGCRGTRRRMEQRAVRLNGDSTAGGQRLVLAVTRDITHQRAAEAENRMLAEVVRRTRNGAVVTDAQGKVVWANEGFMRLSGYALEEMLGRTPGSLLCGPETDAAETARMSEAVKTGSFCVAELVNYAKDGRRYIVRIEIEPIRSPDGAVTGFMAIETDVTRQREIERELGESEARFRSLVNNIPGVAFRVGVDGTNEFISDGVERITGYPASDFVGNAVRDDASVTHPDDRAMVDAAFAKAIAERASYTIEYRVMHRSGDVRWVSEHGQVLCDERTGEPRHVDGVQLDITDRKRAEESLRAATADLEEAQSLGKLGSWAYDVARARLTWSKQVFRLFDRDESLGEPPLAKAIDLYDPRDVPRLRGHVERALSDGEPFSLVLRTRAGAAARHVRAEARVRRSADGRIATIFGTAMDVTAEVEREAELRDARQHAEAASQSKSEFLANMSHEIRTPMTAILGYADLLAESGVRSSAPPERLEYIETIRRNGEHLLAIINDILDVSKIEAGRMTVETIPIRTEAIVANVLLLMAVKAHAKGIRLGGRVLNEVPAVISSDPVRLRQILVNLIGNAIKFTDVGSVRLEVAFVNDGVPRIRFDVIDTGIGLDAKQMTNLFDAFVQADSSTTRRFGGTGLGLRISSRLAEMLGGNITVTSEPGKGSVFSLVIATGAIEGIPSLRPGDVIVPESSVDEQASVEAPGVPTAGPVREAAPETGSTEPPPALTPSVIGVIPPRATSQQVDERPLAGARILLAEDGIDNQRLICFHLGKAGAKMHTVENGRLAIEALTVDGTVDGPLLDPPPFDIVLSDMQMPEMDGYVATRLLREKGCQLPVIALTAHAMSGDREKCMMAGCSDYATKPIDRATVVRLCVDALRGRLAGRRAAA